MSRESIVRWSVIAQSICFYFIRRPLFYDQTDEYRKNCAAPSRRAIYSPTRSSNALREQPHRLEKLEERIQLKAKVASKRAMNKNASKRNEVYANGCHYTYTCVGSRVSSIRIVPDVQWLLEAAHKRGNPIHDESKNEVRMGLQWLCTSYKKFNRVRFPSQQSVLGSWNASRGTDKGFGGARNAFCSPGMHLMSAGGRFFDLNLRS